MHPHLLFLKRKGSVIMVEIIYEDHEIVVCVKPVGVLSQESSACEESMITILKENRKYIAPIHRLDRAVSGIMVYAKTPSAAASLSRQVQENTMVKEYLAAVHGVPGEQEGVLEDILFKDSSKNKSYVVKTMRKGAKRASLEYRAVKTVPFAEGQATLVEICLHTGRTHQIRVQFASRKMPLLGDGKYGGRDHIKQIGLFSRRLTFLHPKTGEKMVFDAFPDKTTSPWDQFV